MNLYDKTFEDVDDLNEYFREYHQTAEYYAGKYNRLTLNNHFLGGLIGQDKNDNWILCQVSGRVKPKQLAYCGRVSDLFKGTLMNNMFIYNLVRQTERKTMKKCGVNLIFDLDGLGKEHFYPATVKIYLNAVKLAQVRTFLVLLQIFIFQDTFPDMMNKIFIINAPSMFVSAYNVGKNVLSARTKNKIQILGTNYNDIVLEELGTENVYPKWGGTKMPKKGNPETGTLLMAGPVPEQFK